MNQSLMFHACMNQIAVAKRLYAQHKLQPDQLAKITLRECNKARWFINRPKDKPGVDQIGTYHDLIEQILCNENLTVIQKAPLVFLAVSAMVEAAKKS